MILLTATTMTLQVVLDAAPTTTQATLYAAWADHTSVAFTPGQTNGLSDGTNAVDIVGAPAASTQRQVKYLSIYNGDTSQMTVTVLLNDNTTLRTLERVILLAGERIEYADGKGFSVYNAAGAQKVTAVQSTVEPSYVDGLLLRWVTGASLTVTSGTCYIPSVGANVNLPSDINKAGLSLSANTWYHVYAFLNSGVPDVEIVTTTPSSPYNGVARTKSGDTTRRYLGSVRTDASGAIYAFKHHSNGSVIYMASIIGAPFLVLNGGNATVATNIDLSQVVPLSASAAYLQARNTDASVAVVFGTSDQGYSLTASAFQTLLDASSAVIALLNTNASQVVTYLFRSAPTGVVNVRCTGYVLER